jgi:predicted RNA-binding protein with RPS1 domain
MATKTARELNQEHDRKQQERVRPKQPEYNFKPLEDVIRKWTEARVNREQT